MKTDRRTFVRMSALAGAGAFLSPVWGCGAARPVSGGTGVLIPPLTSDKFELPPLGYAYTALEPAIDAQTMEIHHSRHHAAYVNNLNAALPNHTAYHGMSLEAICAAVEPGDSAIRNNAGGHWNHTMFWRWMKPGGSSEPAGDLRAAIERDFGSVQGFRDEFTAAAKSRFGSGWAWLCVRADKSLYVASTANQDNPLMRKIFERPGIPVLGIDVWEHAYYLKYQNRRPDYISAFMNLINWDEVSHDFAAAVR
jgi:superoxide dismutase, Fe-Mn family